MASGAVEFQALFLLRPLAGAQPDLFWLPRKLLLLQKAWEPLREEERPSPRRQARRAAGVEALPPPAVVQRLLSRQPLSPAGNES